MKIRQPILRGFLECILVALGFIFSGCASNSDTAAAREREWTAESALVGMANRVPKEMNDGDWDAAIADLDSAIVMDTASDPADVPEIYVMRGAAWEGKGDAGRALADFNQALQLDPKNADAYYFRGVAGQNKGDFADALADYDKAIELKPDADSTRLDRQLLRLRLGKPPGDFAQTVAGWPDSWSKSLGRFIVGELDETALLAAAQKPGYTPAPVQQSEADYTIGMMRLLKGDTTGARVFLQKCVAEDTKEINSVAQRARAELARLDAPVPN